MRNGFLKITCFILCLIFSFGASAASDVPDAQSQTIQPQADKSVKQGIKSKDTDECICDENNNTPVPDNAEKCTCPEVPDTLVISNAWARQSMSSSNNNSAIYMEIDNPTDRQITIIDASAMSTANIVELHQSFVDEQGVSRMVKIDKIVIPANTKVELKPGSIHIMLFKLKHDLKPGDKFKLTIQLDNMNNIPIEVEVK